MTNGTLITVVPTGVELSKTDIPALPVTLDEIVTTARECEAVGASVIDVHVRDADGRPSFEPGLLKATVAAIRAETNLISRLPADPDDARLSVLDIEPEMIGCAVAADRWDFLVELHSRLPERGIVPLYEISELGQIRTLHRLLSERGLPFGGHVHVEFVMNVPGGLAGTTEALVECVRAARDLPDGTTFAATGIGRATIDVMLASLSTGGHLRVGMADTPNYAEGQPADSNMQLVARAVGFTRLAQRPPLTPVEARVLLGVPA